MAIKQAASLSLPYDWEPRPYQEHFWDALMVRQCKRIVIVWHRRAGKDLTMLNALVCKMMQKVGVYWYVFPTYSQGRDIIWNGMTNDGRRFLDAIPKQLIKRKRDDMMTIELVNGSQLFIKGSDRIDNLVGANPIGVIFSEFSIQNPAGWDLIRPILNANDGWAVFVYTPRGYNHGYDLFNFAKKKMVDNPDRFFAELLTIDDTRKPITYDDGTVEWVPVVTNEMVQEDIEAGMPSEMAEQEYHCSFDAALVGSYYGEQMKKAFTEDRITKVPYDEKYLVHTACDLGLADAFAIWYMQYIKNEWRLIDYDEFVGKSLKDVIKHMKDKPYDYGTHLAPHDIKNRELSTGESRIDFAKAHGIRYVTVPRLSVQDGIEAVRRTLSKCTFDQVAAAQGIACLRQYSKTLDPKKSSKETKVYSSTPKHDWTSHGADAFRMFAVGAHLIKDTNKHTEHGRQANANYDVYSHRERNVADSDYDPLGYDY